MKKTIPLDTVRRIAREFGQDIDDSSAGKFYGLEGRPPERTMSPRPGDQAVIRLPQALKDGFLAWRVRIFLVLVGLRRLADGTARW